MIGRRLRFIILALSAVLLAACGASQSSNTAAPTAIPIPTAAAPTAMGAMPGMDHTSMPDMSSSTPMAMDDTKAPYDAQFIDSMIMHHQGAIEMANQALKEATKPEIKTLAENIVKDQQAEIKQMQEWRNAWYPGLAPTAGMGMAMGDMRVSADTSKPFDLRFIEAMIPHHQGAIDMAKDAQQKAEHAEIKTLAVNIITAQEGEIKQMQQWKKDWFNQ